MADKIINIQDAFLNYMRKNKIPVTVFLLNGVKLYGIISCFDQRAIVIKKDGHTQLVYKHAISTYAPHGKITVFDWNGPQPSHVEIQKRDDDDDEYDYDGDNFEDDDYEDEDDDGFEDNEIDSEKK